MARASGVTRRRLTPDQQREIARIYSETGTPVAEIRERFGIGEASLYRVQQKIGVSPRGRPRREASVGPALRPSKRAVTQSGARRQFRVRFQGQRVFDAADVRDALRQAEVLGVIDIVEVTRLA